VSKFVTDYISTKITAYYLVHNRNRNPVVIVFSFKVRSERKESFDFFLTLSYLISGKTYALRLTSDVEAAGRSKNNANSYYNATIERPTAKENEDQSQSMLDMAVFKLPQYLCNLGCSVAVFGWTCSRRRRTGAR
jgi:hypothetical protein